MYYFLHKHRYWLTALVLISVVAIFYFQMKDDGGTVPNAVNPGINVGQPDVPVPSTNSHVAA